MLGDAKKETDRQSRLSGPSDKGAPNSQKQSELTVMQRKREEDEILLKQSEQDRRKVLFYEKEMVALKDRIKELEIANKDLENTNKELT